MKHRSNKSFEQANDLHCSTGGKTCTSHRLLIAHTDAEKLPATRVLIAIIALLIAAFLSPHSAAAQINYATSTQLYRPGTQLNPNLGICVQNPSDASFSEAATDGYTWIRIDTNWANIEKTPYNDNWTVPASGGKSIDEICQLCIKYHLKPHWLVDYGNTTVYGSPCTNNGIQGFAHFAGALAAESVAQGLSGAQYEIWNEPENFGWMDNGSYGVDILTPAQSAQINNASVVSIHAADPTAVVCTSAWGSLQTLRDGGVNAYAQGLDSNGAFNAVGLHTYNLGKDGDPNNGGFNTDEGGYPYPHYNGNDPDTDRNDNPELLMAYNPSSPSDDLYSRITQVLIPGYVSPNDPNRINYWSTETGRRLDGDCNNNQDYFAAEWVRMTLCQWMAGIQWQAHYVADNTGGDATYKLFGTKGETAMKFLTGKTLERVRHF